MNDQLLLNARTITPMEAIRAIDALHSLYVKVVDKEEVKKFQRRLEQTLRERHYDGMADVVEKFNDISDSLGNLLNASQSCRKILLQKRVSREKLRLGDHIFVLREFCGINYTHHGIYGGGEAQRVMEYGANSLFEEAKIRLVTLDKFIGSGLGDVFREESGLSYSREEVWERACSRRSEKRYNLAFRNCENFARWCRTG